MSHIGAWVGFLRFVPYKATRWANAAKNSWEWSSVKRGLESEFARAVLWKTPLSSQTCAKTLANWFDGGLDFFYRVCLMQGRGLGGREARCGEVSGDHGHGLLLFDFLPWWVLAPWH